MREKHSKSSTKLYRVYDNMKTRCYNPNSEDFKSYGALGVTICKEWLDSFESFYLWALANGYKEGLTIDKDELCEAQKIIPKIYSPKTCQWITRQANNKLRPKTRN